MERPAALRRTRPRRPAARPAAERLPCRASRAALCREARAPPPSLEGSGLDRAPAAGRDPPARQVTPIWGGGPAFEARFRAPRAATADGVSSDPSMSGRSPIGKPSPVSSRISSRTGPGARIERSFSRRQPQSRRRARAVPGRSAEEEHITDALLAAQQHALFRQRSALASAIELPAFAPVRSREQEVAERAARKLPVGMLFHRRAQPPQRGRFAVELEVAFGARHNEVFVFNTGGFQKPSRARPRRRTGKGAPGSQPASEKTAIPRTRARRTSTPPAARRASPGPCRDSPTRRRSPD